MKLTETMINGLKKMSLVLVRADTSMAYPDENTAKALERRGLVECVGIHNGWRRYVITDKGRAAIQAVEEME